MGLLDALKSLFAGGSEGTGKDAFFIYVRCDRCSEVIRSRIEKRNELSPSNGGFIWRKELIGSGRTRCFARVEVSLEFDDRREVTEQHIDGGEFVTEEEYDTYLSGLPSETDDSPSA